MQRINGKIFSILLLILFGLIPSFSFATTFKPNLNAGLVGYWTFDNADISGTTIYDRSGYGNNGTTNGSPTISGTAKVKQAVSLNGSTQYVNAGQGGSLKVGASFTTSSWIKTTNNRGYILSKANWATDYYGYELFLGNGKVYFYVDSASNTDVNVSNSTVNDGNWHNIVTVANGSNTFIYIDGVLDHSITQTQTPDYSTNYPLLIGTCTSGSIGNICGTANFFNGYIDEVRIYNRALSINEISALYNSTSNLFKSQANLTDNKGLVGWWKFDDGAGSYANDSSGNGNKGTLVNSPTWVNGKVGKALSFNGSNQKVTIPDNSNLRVNGTFSSFIWAYKNVLNEGYAGYIEKDESSGKNWYMGGNGSGGVYVKIQAGSGSNIFRYMNQNISANQWHLIGFTYDGGSSCSGIHIYVDGQNADYNCDGGPLSSYSQGASPVVLGYDQDDNTYFNGLLDDARIYNRALSSTEIINLYNTTNKTPISILKVLPTPVFSPNAGTITSGSSVTITATGADAIYYTTDGTNPNTTAGGSTSLYTGAITPSTSGTIKAVAVKTGYGRGVIASSKYSLLIIGDNTYGDGANWFPNDAVAYTKYVASGSGTLTKMGVVMDTNYTGNMQIAVYTDNGSNRPGTLLGTSGVITNPTVAGPNEASISGVTLTNGTAYWLAQIGTNPSDTGHVRCSSSGSAYFQYNGGAFPSTASANMGPYSSGMHWYGRI